MMSTTRSGRGTSRLCIADSETRETPVVQTASYAYLRLRDEGYGDADIAHWTETARKLGETASDVFVYFKHEDEGKGAAFGQQMMTLLNQSSIRLLHSRSLSR